MKLPEGAGEITRLFDAMNTGVSGAQDRLFELVYGELRRMARHQMRREGASRTLQTTALVHEAYLKLCGNEKTRWENRRHFFGAAVRAMRQVLIDKARERRAGKRSGGMLVTLDENIAGEEPPVEVLLLGIDGLADTNHLYRRGTHWEKIMESAGAFISAGGYAQWHYIVFQHNQHQVEEARALARDMGFKEFNAKRTGRFLKTWDKTPFSPVLDSDGHLEYLLEMPSDPRYRNETFLKLYADRDASETFLAETPIACKAVQSESIYISAEGLVFPCCWTATIYPRLGQAEREALEHLADQLPDGDGSENAERLKRLRPKGLKEMWRLFDRLPNGKDSINAKLIALKEIIEGPFFQELVPRGWEKKSFEDGRLRVCAKKCGMKRVKSDQNVVTKL